MPPPCQSVSTRNVSLGGNGTLRVGSIMHKKTHIALPQHTANSEHTGGAMDASSGKVQDAMHTILAVLSWILQPSK